MSGHLNRLSSAALYKVAHGEPAGEILTGICKALEKILPGTIVGVTLLDRSSQIFEAAIFPSLADEYAEALRGIRVADKPGSCALAAFNGEAVICEDIATDERFSEAWRNLGLAHGMRALVSIPAMHKDGFALGTLVVAYPPGDPLSRRSRRLADQVADFCALVLSYRRTQLKQELLVGELHHRVRNLFSTIGAVVYATLRWHPEPERFRKTFDGRLAALAKAHSLALDAREVELRELLVDTLAPYSIDHAIEIEGPGLMLTHDAAVAISLAAHELATNAAKYGAFSAHGGSVRIRYGFDEGTEDDRFVLTWVELGGPPVKKPSRQGYGHKTLSRSVASAFDAAVQLDYDPAGLRCRISAPHSPRLGNWIN